MPKTPKERHYAVVNGREGTKIYYGKWDDIKHNALGVSHCKYRGFNTKALAEQFIRDTPARVSPRPVVDTVTMRTDTSEAPVVQSDAPREIGGERVVSGNIDTTGQGAGLDDAQPNIILTHPTEDNVNPEDVTPSVTLSDEQLRILECVRRGQNVFYTGPAGTGKSILIRAIIRLLSEHRKLAITASTGAASVTFPDGRTLHSWAGIGQGTKNAKLLLEDLYTKEMRGARRRWRQTDCLIIDEISMIDGELFDKLDYLGRKLRGNNDPFGGIQLVISGDFCQLPPVPGPSKGMAKFAFEAQSWSRCFTTIHRLTQVFRQRDMRFVNMLGEMMIARMSPESIALIKSLARAVQYDDGIGPIELYPTKDGVAEANQRQLDDIDHPEVVFKGHERGGVDENRRKISDNLRVTILQRLAAPQELVVKEDAQVMLTMNKIQGELVNGTVGIIKDFCTIEEAIRRHIAPFDTTDDAALQRAKDAIPSICRDPESDSGWTDDRYPVVRFPRRRTYFCHPVLFKQENRFGDLMAGRIQVPLIVAWALSIHKSQGATLERVKVDLARVFERGQAYVALSRATSLDTLQVINFNPSKVEAHPYVLRWMGVEVDAWALEEEDFRRAQAEEAYRQSLDEPEEEDHLEYAIDVHD